jgi:hypothetical protein
MLAIHPSPRHISQFKCGRTRTEKRRQQGTLCDMIYIWFVLIKITIF